MDIYLRTCTQLVDLWNAFWQILSLLVLVFVQLNFMLLDNLFFHDADFKLGGAHILFLRVLLVLLAKVSHVDGIEALRFVAVLLLQLEPRRFKGVSVDAFVGFKWNSSSVASLAGWHGLGAHELSGVAIFNGEQRSILLDTLRKSADDLDVITDNMILLLSWLRLDDR